MEVFDKDGKPVEGVFSQEELDAKVQEAVESNKTEFEKAIEEAGTNAVEQFKKDNDWKEPDAGNKGDKEEVPAWAKELTEKVNGLTNNQNRSHVQSVSKMLDADKQKEVADKFDSLSGYDDSPEGLQRKAEDAYLLVTGEKFDAEGIDMSNTHAAGGGERQNQPDTFTDADKDVQNALGITPEDVEKFSGKSE